MLLCIDIGNTSITLGCYDKETLRFVSRMYSLRQKSGDEYASSLDDILHLHGTAAKEIDALIDVPMDQGVSAVSVSKEDFLREMSVNILKETNPNMSEADLKDKSGKLLDKLMSYYSSVAIS